MSLFKFSFLVTFLLQHILGANILFLFGGGNYSHKHSIWPLVMALTQKGHNVTFISSVEKQPSPNPHVLDITPTFMKSMTSGVYDVDRFLDRKEGKEQILSNYDEDTLSLCHSMFAANETNDPQFTHLIEAGAFDLIVVNHIYGDCAAYVAFHLRTKFVFFQSTTVMPTFYSTFGIPVELSWMTHISTRHEYPMTFWDRTRSLFNLWKWGTISAWYDAAMRQAYKERYALTDADVPGIVDVKRKAALVLLNTHHAADYSRSLPPAFIHVGGMQCWEPEGILPQSMKEFMDGAAEGVILISFGSTIEFNKLSEEHLFIFFHVMRQFSGVRFIWRWNGPTHAHQPQNLLGAKWLPQKEILREKSVRALMTHGGMNSQHEAAYYGVPMIVMPLFADQDFQAYRIEAQEIGVKVEAADFSEDMLHKAFWKILNIPTYQKNMQIRSKLFRDRPNPTETAVEALEFVLRHDDLSILKPMALEQSWWVRQHVDIYFFCFVVLATVNLIVPFVLWKIWRRTFTN